MSEQENNEAPRDPSTYTEEEKAMIEKYGRLPKKTDLTKKRNDRLKGVCFFILFSSFKIIFIFEG